MHRIQFAVYPIASKVRYYYNLYDLPNDFNQNELKNANINILLNGVVVGSLITEIVISEIFK